MMRIFLFLFCILMVTSAKEKEEHSNNRLHYGEEAFPGEYPFIVSIRRVTVNFTTNENNYLHDCGGTILTSKFVITAGNCLPSFKYEFGKDDNLYPPCVLAIFAGTVKNENKVGDMYEISKLIRHPEYNNAGNATDLALIETKKEIKFGENVNCLKLPLPDLAVPLGSKVRTMGWGYNENKKISDKLMKTSGTAYGIQRETFYFKGEVITNKTTKVDVGDSGSPLLYNYTLLGVLSERFGKNSELGLYTNVIIYISWIKSHIGEQPSTCWRQTKATTTATTTTKKP